MEHGSARDARSASALMKLIPEETMVSVVATEPRGTTFVSKINGTDYVRVGNLKNEH